MKTARRREENPINTVQMELRLDPARLREQLQKRWQSGLTALAGQVLADCNRYARDDSGALIASSYAASDLPAGRLVWRTGYARRVYGAGTPRLGKNPNASLRWCEKAKALHGPEWTRQVARTLGGDTDG